jgi:S-adenosylmethionine synthetase
VSRKPRMTSSVVDCVLDRCKKLDPDSQLASATFTQDGETLVRVRTGITCSISSLQQAISNTMPLCGTEVVDSPLDGTTEIGVIVPTMDNEIRIARNIIRRRMIPRAIGHVGFLCFVFGLASWIVFLFESLGTGDKREL